MGVDRRSQAGAISAELVAVVIVLAALVAAVVAIALPSHVDEATSNATDCLFGRDCAELSAPSEGTAPGSPDQPDPVAGDEDAPAVASPADPDADDSAEQTQRDTEAVLDETEIGQDFRDYHAENPIELRWVPGEGAYWNGQHIQLDTSWATDDVAATYIHELTHDQMGRTQGDRPDPGDYDDAAGYREAMADFEVRAMLNEITFYGQLEEGRGDDYERTNRDRFYRQMYEDAADDAYERAYESALDRDAVQLGPITITLDDDDRREAFARAVADGARERATYDALMQEFLDGNMVGSNSGEAYVDVWDTRWEEANRSCGFLGYRCWFS